MIDCATSKNMATANGLGFDGYHDHYLIKGNTMRRRKLSLIKGLKNERLENATDFAIQ